MMNRTNNECDNTPVDWGTCDEILSRIRAPVFPDRDFPITGYGAVSGGRVNCGESIRRAILACAASGGGRVVVPEGVFLTGPVHLESNVNLHLSEGSTLLFSTDFSLYLPVVPARWEGIECMNYSPFIYASGKENIALTGNGTLDGGASYDDWWAWKDRCGSETQESGSDAFLLAEYGERDVPIEQRIFGEGHFLRPNFFEPHNCRNVLLEGVTFLRSPMWEINPVLCVNVIVRGVTIHSHGPNNDGCDPESCRDVLIENCVFDTGDDCIAIKSGRNNDGRRTGVPCENIIIRDCVMEDGHGGVSIGSEISGGCRNVFIENCSMDSPELARAIRFKSNAKRGGVIENTFIRNVKIGRVAEAVLTVDFMYDEGPNGPHFPVVRNVHFENVESSSAPRICLIQGFRGATIDNISFRRCSFSGITSTEVISHAGRIEMNDVTVQPAEKVKAVFSRKTVNSD
jgi:unsaturated rhamnogalacturonyl hydrolase